MSLFRSKSVNSLDRPSLLIQLRLTDKKNDPIDQSDAWQALIDAFKDHPYLEVYQAEIRAFKDES
jgi:hypothetical protein